MFRTFFNLEVGTVSQSSLIDPPLDDYELQNEAHNVETISLRAAQYVRMSTDKQIYSTQNQSDAIAGYAAIHNLTIVRTYKDEARSGLVLDRRQGLKDLLSDVLSGHADFERILVYDVSRWGRFQDADESAHYEFICKEAGVKVEYCAEEFVNDGSLMSTVVKNLKRAMAGEYSRELSVKTFAAHCRLVKLGFWQGGPPGFGLRRMLIDEKGQPRGLLTQGQRKHLKSDRVILVLGPARELATVRRIFRQFVLERKSESKIARELNQRGVMNPHGRPWTNWTIRYLLKNECYIGNNVYNKKTFRLRQKGRDNAPNLWIRATGVFETKIVDPSLFARAKEYRRERRTRLSNREMLARLSSLLKEKGHLNAKLIDDAEYLPCTSSYMSRFGSLRTAYKLVQYHPKGNFNYIDGANLLTTLIRKLASDIIAMAQGVGGSCSDFDEETDRLTINGKLTVSIYVARCRCTAGGWLRWTVRRRADLGGDIIVAPRIDQTSRTIIDYLLLPAKKFPVDRMEFSERNRTRLDGCRFDSVEDLFREIWRLRDDPLLIRKTKRGRPFLHDPRLVG